MPMSSASEVELAIEKLTLGLRTKKLLTFMELDTFCAHIFKIIFSTFFFFKV